MKLKILLHAYDMHSDGSFRYFLFFFFRMALVAVIFSFIAWLTLSMEMVLFYLLFQFTCRHS